MYSIVIMVTTVLLCPPKYYDIEYEINPWMHVENKVDKQKVQEEFENLKHIYQKLGLNVWILDPQHDLPDMVYTANCGFVIDDLFIKANFKYPQRRKESDFAEKLFRDKKFKIATLPKNIFFEGQGDLFYRDGKFFLGYGKRTAKEAVKPIEDILRENIIPIEVNDPYYYHLDTCFAPLGNGKVIVKSSSLTKEGLEKIKNNFKTVIMVEEKDHPFLCCNICAVADTVIAGEGIGKEIKSKLQENGFDTIETPTKEYFKGGGSVKCLTLEFFKSF